MKSHIASRAWLAAAIGMLAFTVVTAAPLETPDAATTISGLDESYPALTIVYNYEKGDESEYYTRDGEFHRDAVTANGALIGVTVLNEFIPLGAKGQAKDGGVIVTTTTTKNPDGSTTILTTVTKP